MDSIERAQLLVSNLQQNLDSGMPFLGECLESLCRIKCLTEEEANAEKVSTMCTDGRHIFINVGWADKLSAAEFNYVLIHELHHVYMEHAFRAKNFAKALQKRTWNEAADSAINAEIIDDIKMYKDDCDLDLAIPEDFPPCVEYDQNGKPIHNSAEVFYTLFVEKNIQQMLSELKLEEDKIRSCCKQLKLHYDVTRLDPLFESLNKSAADYFRKYAVGEESKSDFEALSKKVSDIEIEIENIKRAETYPQDSLNSVILDSLSQIKSVLGIENNNSQSDSGMGQMSSSDASVSKSNSFGGDSDQSDDQSDDQSSEEGSGDGKSSESSDSENDTSDEDSEGSGNDSDEKSDEESEGTDKNSDGSEDSDEESEDSDEESEDTNDDSGDSADSDEESEDTDENSDGSNDSEEERDNDLRPDLYKKFFDPKDDPDESSLQSDVQAALIEIAERNWSSCPGSIRERVQKYKRVTHTNWKRLLSRFLSSRINEDRDYAHPDRHFIPFDMIRPGDSEGEELYEVSMYIDTSGSISDAKMKRYFEEAYTLVTEFGCKLNLATWNTRIDSFIKGVEEDNLDEAYKSLVVKGGGTNITCVYKNMLSDDRNAIVYLVMTDGCFPTPDVTPQEIFRFKRKAIFALFDEDFDNDGISEPSSTLGTVCSLGSTNDSNS